MATDEQRLGLVAFAVALLLLFGIVAMAEGIGDPDIPPGAVAVVETISGQTGVITEAEVRAGITQYAARKVPPDPTDPQYDYFRERALGVLLEGAWTQGEADRLGIAVSPRKVSFYIRGIKASYANDEEYLERLKLSHITPAEAREEVRLKALNAKLAEIASGADSSEASDKLERIASEERAAEFFRDFSSIWTSRTFCAPGYEIERCSNFKGNGHSKATQLACYEANPENGRPASCPAPVRQLVPALPGSVTPLKPDGIPLAQRPRPSSGNR